MRKLKVTEFAKFVGVSRQYIGWYIRKNKDKGYLTFRGKNYAFEVEDYKSTGKSTYLIVVKEDGE